MPNHSLMKVIWDKMDFWNLCGKKVLLVLTVFCERATDIAILVIFTKLGWISVNPILTITLSNYILIKFLWSSGINTAIKILPSALFRISSLFQTKFELHSFKSFPCQWPLKNKYSILTKFEIGFFSW